MSYHYAGGLGAVAQTAPTRWTGSGCPASHPYPGPDGGCMTEEQHQRYLQEQAASQTAATRWTGSGCPASHPYRTFWGGCLSFLKYERYRFFRNAAVVLGLGSFALLGLGLAFTKARRR